MKLTNVTEADLEALARSYGEQRYSEICGVVASARSDKKQLQRIARREERMARDHIRGAIGMIAMLILIARVALWVAWILSKLVGPDTATEVTGIKEEKFKELDTEE